MQRGRIISTARASTRTVLAAFSLYTWLSFFAIAHGEMRIDGRLDESEWQQAVHCSQWQRTEPFALDEPRFGNEVQIVATPQGLAAGFTIDQPAGERRDRPRTPRDSEGLVASPDRCRSAA